MTRISAADNIVIDAQPKHWRMLINTDFVDSVSGDGILLEVVPDEPLRYTSVFARTRRFPKDGSLPTRYIQRVLLGWSADDEAYHLGLVVAPRLAEARGSRWCALARWPDPERDVFYALAREAGESLAAALDCPFSMAPMPKHNPQPTPKPKPLPPLPLKLQGWEMWQNSNGWLLFARQGAWARERVRRVLWYGFWTVIYILLAVATIRSDIALPRPEFLPYLGLATAAMLIGLVGYSLYELRRTARRIVVDPATRQVWGVVDKPDDKPVWRMGRQHVDSVYVSQIVKQKKQMAVLDHAEINLRLTSGGYYHLLRLEDSQPLGAGFSANGDSDIIPLKRDVIQTDVQAAGAYIAEALDVPVWYDHRAEG